MISFPFLEPQLALLILLLANIFSKNLMYLKTCWEFLVNLLLYFELLHLGNVHYVCRSRGPEGFSKLFKTNS